MRLLLAVALLVVLSYFIVFGNNLVDYAIKYNGTLETKPNRSYIADISNKYVGNKIGSPYCIAFVCYCLNESGYKYQKTGLATKFKGKKLIPAIDVLLGKAKVKKGYVIIWQKGISIFGHAGISIEDWQYNEGMTIQGNTRYKNKDGVFIKKAKIEPYNYFRIIRFWEV